jgi:Nif-specific regulatory protein
MKNNDLLELRAAAGFEDLTLSNIAIPINKGLIGVAASEKREIYIPDVRNDVQYIPINENIRTLFAVPILYNDLMIGVLSLESEEYAAYDQNIREIIISFGNNLGSIIYNIRLLDEIRHQVEQQKQINTISGKIRQSVNVEGIMQISANEIGKALNADRVQIKLGSTNKHDKDTFKGGVL